MNYAALVDAIGKTERAANLDQLASRNDDFFALAEGREDQQRCRGILVDDDRGLSDGQTAQEFFNRMVSFPA